MVDHEGPNLTGARKTVIDLIKLDAPFWAREYRNPTVLFRKPPYFKPESAPSKQHTHMHVSLSLSLPQHYNVRHSGSSSDRHGRRRCVE